MYQPTIFFDSQFTVAVMAGWVLTLLGAGALLLASFWWSFCGEWLGDTKPPAFRLLTFLGFAMFIGGIVWQFVGYWRVGTLSW